MYEYPRTISQKKTSALDKLEIPQRVGFLITKQMPAILFFWYGSFSFIFFFYYPHTQCKFCWILIRMNSITWKIKRPLTFWQKDLMTIKNNTFSLFRFLKPVSHVPSFKKSIIEWTTLYLCIMNYICLEKSLLGSYLNHFDQIEVFYTTNGVFDAN